MTCGLLQSLLTVSSGENRGRMSTCFAESMAGLFTPSCCAPSDEARMWNGKFLSFVYQTVSNAGGLHPSGIWLKVSPHRDLIYWGLTFLSPAENMHLRECLWEWGVVRASEVSCCLAVRNHHPLVGNAGVKGEGIIFSVVLRSSIPCCFRELTTFWNKNVSQMPWLLLGPFMKVKQRLL